ncbi:MAG: hypothetical protein Q7J34_13050 [Bacteroidales bacterium]|nr:hypothetical protein [Bacteroidales bacterium]
MNTKTGLSFGILCNSYHFQQWQAMAIEKLLAENHRICVLIMPDIKKEEKTHRFPLLPFSTLFFRIYTRIFFQPESKQVKDLKGLLKDVPLIYAQIYREGIADYFTDTTIVQIQQCKPDFLLRFGFSIIRGRILDCCPWGVWSFHHDDPSVYRGVPSNFWEIYHGDIVNGAVLQRLNNSVDQGEILWQAWFPVIHHSWKNNLDEAYFQSALWPAQVCRKITNDQEISQQMPYKKGNLKRIPNNRQLLYFILLLLYNRIDYHYRCLFRREMWISGVRFINRKEINWLPEGGTSEYKADAFVFKILDQYYVLFEQYDYHHPKGKIMMQKFDQNLDMIGDATVAIEEKGHLAFPFTFKHQGSVYCCPESSTENIIRLYRFNPEMECFDFHCTILEGIAAVDPVIQYHDGKWWLFFTEKQHSTSVLHIWYSDTPEGPYQPHLLNPVKTDVRSSRPAGALFSMNGNLFRPTQDCSKYSGHRISINRVNKLSVHSFEEETEDYIGADLHNEYKDGIHTWHHFEDVVSFDCKKHGR